MYYDDEYTEMDRRDAEEARYCAEERDERERMQDYAMEAKVKSDLFSRAADHEAFLSWTNTFFNEAA